MTPAVDVLADVLAAVLAIAALIMGTLNGWMALHDYFAPSKHRPFSAAQAVTGAMCFAVGSFSVVVGWMGWAAQ